MRTELGLCNLGGETKKSFDLTTVSSHTECLVMLKMCLAGVKQPEGAESPFVQSCWGKSTVSFPLDSPWTDT